MVLPLCANTFDPACDPIAIPVPPSPISAPSYKNNVFFSLDLLVWDARAEGLEYAYSNSQTQSNQELSSFEPESKFEPALRIEFGGFLPYDNWVLGALYTYYHSNRNHLASQSFDPLGVPGPGIISTWTYPSAFSNNNTGARFQSANNQWKLNCSFLDLSLKKDCPISSSFTVTPLFGLRSAWLHQHYNVNYNSGNTIVFASGIV